MPQVLTGVERQMALSEPVVSDYRMRRSRRAYSAVADAPVRRGTGRAVKGAGWRRKPADEDLLRFLTLHGVVTLRQASRWFYRGVGKTAEYRVRLLCEAGLLVRHQVEPWAGVVLVPTLDGQTVGLESAQFPVSHQHLRGHTGVPAQLLHRLLVSEQTLAARAAGRRVISERQIRMLDARGEDETALFLQSEGVAFSADGVAAGVCPSELTVTAEQDGRTVVDGTRNTWLALPIHTPWDERMNPLSQQRSGLRFPDFLTVTDTGELEAVEVEISAKSEDRVRRLVQGYARSLPRVETRLGEEGEPRRRLRRSQFRHARWVVSPEVGFMLRGHTDLLSGRHAPGLVQQCMPEVFGPDYDWRQQNRKLPVTVDDAASDDDGIQYALDQRGLEPQWQCDYRTWRRWRALWRTEVPEDMRGAFPFSRWIRVPENFAACRRRGY